MVKSTACFLVLLAAAGCESGRTTASEDLGVTREKIVGGTISPASQDSVVDIVNGDESCTGTLIAPDLVITAQHCVAADSESDCGTLGAEVAASALEIKLNTVGATPDDDATFNSPTIAKGVKIYRPKTANTCSYDVSIIKLDKAIPNAKISPLRFSALAANEKVVAVGFGTDGNDVEQLQRMQRQTTVLGVGPTTVKFVSQTDGSFNFVLPEGDVMTGESHCFGDSGGPLFDLKGNIVAIISRGPEGAPDPDTDKKHGNGCIDMAESYAGIKFNEQFIRDSAKDAGHELPAGDTATPQTTTPPKSSTAPSGDDDDDDDTTSSTKKKSSTTSNNGDTLTSSGCSTTPGSHENATLLVLLGVALVLTRRRR